MSPSPLVPVRLGLALGLLALATVPARSQTTAEAGRSADPYDVSPHVGYLLQADAHAGAGVDPDGFVLRTARLRYAGEASEAARYFVQAELVRSPAVLDARLALRLAGPVEVVAGLYKSPFSREFLLFGGALPLTERARAVAALAPGRQVGTSLRAAGRLGPADATVEAGVFNGNGGRTFVNDGDGLLVVGRAEAAWPTPVGTLRLGASGAHGRDDAAPIPTLDDAFAGTRSVVGADDELTTPRLYVLAEALAARLDGTEADRRPWGGAVTASVETLPRLRVVGRLDVLDSDPPDAGPRPERVRWAAGLDLEPAPHVRAQADYGFPHDDPAHGDLRLRLQLALR